MAKEKDLTPTITEISNQATEHSAQIVEQFGDGIPYNRQRVVDETRFYLAQSAEAMLEAGKRLLLIKEHEPHGDFIDIVENRLGIHARAAQRMMNASLKYLSPKLQSKAIALSHLGKTKLFELIAEDDDDLAALAEGGTIAGLTLDEVDRMSSRELRAALREAREQDKAKDQVIANKNQQIDKLDTELQQTQNKYQLNPPPPEEEAVKIREQAARIGFEAERHLRVDVREAFQAVLDQGEEHGLDTGIWIRGQLDQIADSFNYLCEQLGMVSWIQQNPPYERGDDAESDSDIPLWNGETGPDKEVKS